MMLNELRVGSIVTHPLFGTPTNVKAIAFNGLYIGTKDDNRHLRNKWCHRTHDDHYIDQCLWDKVELPLA